MTEEELKIKFDHIQGIFNRCINHASQVMIDNIASKSLYFDAEQADKLEQQEYVRTLLTAKKISPVGRNF